MSNKREQAFAHDRPENGYAVGTQSGLNDPGEPMQRATAAQMATRKIAGKRAKTPRSQGTGGVGFMNNAFGASQTSSFPPAQPANPIATSSNASFPPAAAGDKSAPFTSSTFSFSAASGFTSNPFAAQAEGKENETPAANGIGSSVFAASTSAPQAAPFTFGQSNASAAPQFSFPNPFTQGGTTPTTQAGQPTTSGNFGQTTSNSGSNLFGHLGGTQSSMFGKTDQNASTSSLFAPPNGIKFGGTQSNALGQGIPNMFGSTSSIQPNAPQESPSAQPQTTPKLPIFGQNLNQSQGSPSASTTGSLFGFNAGGASSTPQPKPSFGGSITTQPPSSTPGQTTTPSPTEDAMHTSPDFVRIPKDAPKDKVSTRPASNDGAAATPTPAAAPTFGSGSVFGNPLQRNSGNSTPKFSFGSDAAKSTGFSQSTVDKPSTLGSFQTSSTPGFSLSQPAPSITSSMFAPQKPAETSSVSQELNPSQETPKATQEPPKFGSFMGSTHNASNMFAPKVPDQTPAKDMSTPLESRSGTDSSLGSKSTPIPSFGASTKTPLFQSLGVTKPDQTSLPPGQLSFDGTPKANIFSSSFKASDTNKLTPNKAPIDTPSTSQPLSKPSTSLIPHSTFASLVSIPDAPAHLTGSQKSRFREYFWFRCLNRHFKTLVEDQTEGFDWSSLMAWYQHGVDAIRAGAKPEFLTQSAITYAPSVLGKRAVIEAPVEEDGGSAAKKSRGGSTQQSFTKPVPSTNSAPPANSTSSIGIGPSTGFTPSTNSALPPSKNLFSSNSTPNANLFSTGSPTKKRSRDEDEETPPPKRSLFNSPSSTPFSSKRKAEEELPQGTGFGGSASKKSKGAESTTVSLFKAALEKKDPSPPSQSAATTSKSASPTPSTSGGTSVFDDPPHKAPFTSGNFFGHLSKKNQENSSDKENEEATDEEDEEDEDAEGDVEADADKSASEPEPKFPAATGKSSMFNFPKRTTASPSPTPPVSGFTPADKHPGGLWNRIKLNPDGTPERELPVETEKDTTAATEKTAPTFGSFMTGKPAPGFGSTSIEKTPRSFGSSITENSTNIFGASTSGKPSTSLTSTTPSKPPNIFGSSIPGDHTWNRESPIKFGDSTASAAANPQAEKDQNGPHDEAKDATDSTSGTKPNPGLSVTPASPSQQNSTLGNGSVTTPKPTFSFGSSTTGNSLFPNIGSTTPSGSLAKPFSLNSQSNVGSGSSLFNFTPSQLPSSTTSRASTPGLSAGDTSAPESSAAEGDGKQGDEFGSLPQATLSDLTAEERENEEVLFEAKVKVRQSIKDADGNTVWETKGTGPLRILKHKSTGAVRTLMRSMPSGKVVLNARVPKGILASQPKPKMVVLALSEGDDTKNVIPRYVTIGTDEAAKNLVQIFNENQQ